ncbi:MAG TPA: twin-arginine translocase subunit TatC [Chitinophagaceae bacterium]|nr:twin-arginine translocase subunit TatC [Chitinophagaceae bacterium]
MALLDFFNRRIEEGGKEMSFIDHLEELRWHIIRSVIAVLIGAILVFIYANTIVDRVILGPAHPEFITYKWLCVTGRALHLGDALCINNVKVSFLSTAMTEQFMSTFTIAFVGGFILAFPYVFWEFWKFVKPALTEKELKRTRGVIFWVSLLFFLGVAFGYYILTPFMVNFYFSYSLSPLIEIKPTFSDYLENLIYTTVGIGVLFQMPLLVMVLAKIGIITPAFLKRYRRHAFVIILIAAAIITPSTDPFSLTLVTIPLYILYEASIAVASRVYKDKAKQDAQEWS